MNANLDTGLALPTKRARRTTAGLATAMAMAEEPTLQEQFRVHSTAGLATAVAIAEEPTLQKRFEALRQRRVAACAGLSNATAGPRSQAERAALRQKFVAATRSYIGTPYSARRNGEGAPLYMDCASLVRQVLLDLRGELGFTIGGWNQCYLYDMLPREAALLPDLQPGDLIFWTAEPGSRTVRHRHNLVHVEVFMGGATGEATVGSRFDPETCAVAGVSRFDSFRSFRGHGNHSHRVIFRSIDPWLDGVARNCCPTCRWAEPKGGGAAPGDLPSKFSMFVGNAGKEN